MNCKRCIKMIPKFLNDELENNDLRDFIEHTELCSDCKEELTIEILIKEGLNSLEEGNSFDLNKEFKSRVEQASRILVTRENLLWIYYALAGLVVVLSFMVFILLVFV